MPAKLKALGLHLTDAAIKAAWITPTSTGYEITAFGQKQLPMSLIEGGEVVDLKGLASQIKETIDSPLWGKFDTKNVVCSLPESRVFQKILVLPYFKKQNISEMVMWEAQSVVPIPKDQAYFYWQVLEEHPKEGKVEILVLACEKEFVDKLLTTLEMAGLETVSLDLDSMAVTRTIDLKDASDKIVMQVHVGMVSTTVTIIKNGKVWFSSVIKTGGRDLIAEYSRRKMISLTEAGGEIYEKGIVETYPEATIKELVTGIENAITFQNERSIEGNKVSYVLMTGSNSVIPGLVEKLKENLKMDVRVASPKYNLQIPQSGKQVNPLLTVIGVGIRGAVGIGQNELEFLPSEVKEKAEAAKTKVLTRRLLRGFNIFGVICIMFLGFIWIRTEMVRQDSQEQVVDLKKINDSNPVKKLFPWVESTNKTLNTIVSLEEFDRDISEILKLISINIPRNITLTQVSYSAEQGKWRVTGSAPDRETIIVFQESLKSSDVVEEVELPLSSLGNTNLDTFSLEFKVKGEQVLSKAKKKGK